mgnify:CR=1 FL=1
MKRDGKKKRPTRLKQNGINPKHFSAGQLKIHAYLVPICVIMALPIVFIISNAFKPIDELMAYPPRFFVRRPTLDNFISLFNLSSSTSIPASRYLFNSVITTVITVLGALIICACAAYVFSKKRFKFNGVLFKINSLALMFVPIAVSIPRYFVITYTGILDTLWANILPLLVMPTGVFLVKQFMDQLPTTLIEAAEIDGATAFTIFRKIVMSTVKPAWLTLMVFAFQSVWNSNPQGVVFDEQLKLLQSAISEIVSSGISRVGVSMAGSLFIMIPPILIFVFSQNSVIETMAHSGIKD